MACSGKSDSFMLDAFRWFGTYLAWIPDEFAKTSRDGRGDFDKELFYSIFNFIFLFAFIYLFVYLYVYFFILLHIFLFTSLYICIFIYFLLFHLFIYLLSYLFIPLKFINFHSFLSFYTSHLSIFRRMCDGWPSSGSTAQSCQNQIL